MSAGIERKCGTCKFWQRENWRHMGVGYFGDCDHPATKLPHPESMSPMDMQDDDGQECPCWEPKQ